MLLCTEGAMLKHRLTNFVEAERINSFHIFSFSLSNLLSLV
jgi:hypothetical protein